MAVKYRHYFNVNISLWVFKSINICLSSFISSVSEYCNLIRIFFAKVDFYILNEAYSLKRNGLWQLLILFVEVNLLDIGTYVESYFLA